MGLEVKLIVHGHAGSIEVGNMFIQQVAQGEGNLRDYEVSGWHQPMATRGRLMGGGLVLAHDRVQEPVWQLVAKAIGAMGR